MGYPGDTRAIDLMTLLSEPSMAKCLMSDASLDSSLTHQIIAYLKAIVPSSERRGSDKLTEYAVGMPEAVTGLVAAAEVMV